MLERGASEVEVQALLKERAELERILRECDERLDEFGIGLCAVPPQGEMRNLPEAVQTAMATMRRKIAMLQRHRKMLRETLTQVKVDHANKKIHLPIPTHAAVENTLNSTKTDELL